jgi:hypothetical protein
MIAIDRVALAAISQFSARDDTRHYLQSVCVEADEKSTILIGTDGHILGAHHSDAKGENALTEHEAAMSKAKQIILPLDIVKRFAKVDAKSRRTPGLLLHLEDPTTDEKGIQHVTRKAKLISAGEAVEFELIDATYPDWRHIVPAWTNGKLAQFNPAFLVRIQKAAMILRDADTASVHVHHNGERAALIDVGLSTLLAVIMPYRTAPDNDGHPPAWTGISSKGVGDGKARASTADKAPPTLETLRTMEDALVEQVNAGAGAGVKARLTRVRNMILTLEKQHRAAQPQQAPAVESEATAA